MSDWKMVGKVKEAHGLKGELFVLIFAKEFSWKKKLKEFTLGSSEGVTDLKLSVQSIREIKGGLIIKPKEIPDRTAAEKLEGQYFHIPSSFFISAPGESIFLAEILGFTVYDGDVLLGEIKSFSSNGPQDILVVAAQKQNYEVLFVEAFIKNVDFKNRSVHMNLPEGLLASQEAQSAKDDD